MRRPSTFVSATRRPGGFIRFYRPSTGRTAPAALHTGCFTVPSTRPLQNDRFRRLLGFRPAQLHAFCLCGGYALCLTLFKESRERRTQGETQAGRTAQENGENGKRNQGINRSTAESRQRNMDRVSTRGRNLSGAKKYGRKAGSHIVLTAEEQENIRKTVEEKIPKDFGITGKLWTLSRTR